MSGIDSDTPSSPPASRLGTPQSIEVSSSRNSDPPQDPHHHVSTHDQLTTHIHAATSPLWFLHPTRTEFPVHSATTSTSPQGNAHWSSRASRKNRYPLRNLHVRRGDDGRSEDEEGTPTGGDVVQVQQRVRYPGKKHEVHFAWDISFWVAVIFVVGSAVWVVNGFLLFLPLLGAASDHGVAAAWFALAGGTIFEVGSYLMLVEALNTGHEQLFGPALWGLISWRDMKGVDPAGTEGPGHEQPQSAGERVGFRWIGLGPWRELGFLACFIQFWGATIFWISTITGLPGVISTLSTSPSNAIADIFFWTPQVVGGTCFVLASFMFMLETQHVWWKPAPLSLGWHIGLWNLIGALGFTLCGALGYASFSSSKVVYQSVLSTYWGSWAFLIGSAIQLWETLWREDST